ncbi:MAG: HD domain-containing protein [Pseudoramibacter sp.]
MQEIDQERLRQQLDFILEIDKEKNVFRQTHLSGGGRAENDAEHAWHMAVMMALLSEYADADFDLARGMLMCLIHDIVEIDAGDTYAYDEQGKKTQNAREEKAADRIFGLLPEDQDKKFRALFEEFDAGVTPEARFARVMDNLQPVLLNDANGGADWLRHGVKRHQIEKRQQKTKQGSLSLYGLIETIIDRNVAAGHIAPDTEDESLKQE